MIEGLAAIWNAPTGAPSTSAAAAAAAAAPPRQDLIVGALCMGPGALKDKHDVTTFEGARGRSSKRGPSFF